MKILPMFLVHRVEKMVRKLLSRVESFCMGGIVKWIEGLCWDTEKTLDFFWGGGRIKLVSEFAKSSRKGVIVFKGKQFKVVEAIDGR